MSLSSLFGAISRSADPGYSARLIPGSTLHFIARDADGNPCLLFGSKDAPHELTHAIRLQSIEVQFAVLCRVSMPDGQSSEQRLSVVRCISTDAEVQHYFLKVAETIVQLIGPSPAFAKITEVLRRVVELFRRLDRPRAREIAGLYGELLFISWSRDVAESLRAWRRDATDQFDFSASEVRIDVKATCRRSRIHNFSIDQCRPPPGTIGVIASILLEQGAGASISDLIGRIESRIMCNPELVMKLHEGVSEALGASLADGLRSRFDDKVAKHSLKLFFSEDIPAPQGSIPVAVSEVRFKSDLSGVEGRTRKEIVERALAANSLMPAEYERP